MANRDSQEKCVLLEKPKNWRFWKEERLAPQER